MRTVAQIFSFLFHPLILVTYAFVLVYVTNPLLFSAYDSRQVSQIFLTVIINTFIFPVITILLLWRLGFIKSLMMADQKERLIPYLVTGFYYIWAYVVFRKSGMPQLFDIVILGGTITLFVVFLFNIFWKVSAHAGATGCLFVLAVALTFFSTADTTRYVLLIVLLGGVVGSSRLLLKAHTPAEIFTGYFIGMASQLVALHFF